jgi:acyl carrier protein
MGDSLQGSDQRLRQIVARIAHKSPQVVASDATWRVLGLDSLDLFDLLVAVELEFGVEIPDAQAVGFYCIADLVHYLQANGRAEVRALDRGPEVGLEPP